MALSDEPTNFLGAVVANSTDHVNNGYKDRSLMFRDKKTGGIIDGIAWSATHSEQLRLWFGPWTNVGNIGVAIAINLAGTHHHMSASAGNGVENTAEGNPAFNDFVCSTDGQVSGDKECFTVADH